MADKCYRCSTCNVGYPPETDYEKCPKCSSQCWLKDAAAKDSVLTPAEAKSLKAHCDFERYCEARDAQKVEEELAQLSSVEPGDLIA